MKGISLYLMNPVCVFTNNQRLTSLVAVNMGSYMRYFACPRNILVSSSHVSILRPFSRSVIRLCFYPRLACYCFLVFSSSFMSMTVFFVVMCGLCPALRCSLFSSSSLLIQTALNLRRLLTLATAPPLFCPEAYRHDTLKLL